MKWFVLVLRLGVIRKVIVTRLLPTKAPMLKREIADISAVETANEHVAASNVSVLELFMFLC